MIRDIENNLKIILEKIVGERVFPSPEGIKKKFKIFTGYISAEDEGNYTPAVAIRINKGKNTLENRVLNCHIVIQMFNDESTEIAYDNLYEVGNLIIDKLIEQGTINNLAEITPNLTWEVPEQQVIPFYIFDINLELISPKAYRTDVDNWLNGGE